MKRKLGNAMAVMTLSGMLSIFVLALGVLGVYGVQIVSGTHNDSGTKATRFMATLTGPGRHVDGKTATIGGRG